MTTYTALSALLSIIFIFIVYLLNFKQAQSNVKITPFECGFYTVSSSSTPFSARFFMVAIIFLIFDLELIFLLPFLMKSTFTSLIYSSLLASLFVLVLSLGLFYEWNNKSLEWSKFTIS